MPIPKKIHYVWVGNAKIPDVDQSYIDGWHQLHPDYEIHCWSEKDIDLDKYPLVKKAIKEKRWALASDIIRMYIVYREGGIYMDTDMELYKSLDDLLKYNAFACWESNFWFTTSIFGARKHSPWIGKILKRYEKMDFRHKITTDDFMKTVHSPSIYASDFIDLKTDGKTRIYNKKFAVFSSDYFCPRHYSTGKENITENTRGYHHYASTWHTRKEKLDNFISKTALNVFGRRIYSVFEYIYHHSLEKKIRRDLP